MILLWLRTIIIIVLHPPTKRRRHRNALALTRAPYRSGRVLCCALAEVVRSSRDLPHAAKKGTGGRIPAHDYVPRIVLSLFSRILARLRSLLNSFLLSTLATGPGGCRAQTFCQCLSILRFSFEFLMQLAKVD